MIGMRSKLSFGRLEKFGEVRIGVRVGLDCLSLVLKKF